MQIISVERWTFWAAFALIFVGMALATGSGSPAVTIGLLTWNIAAWLLLPGFALLAISVGLGNSSDPSVRRLPSRTAP